MEFGDSGFVSASLCVKLGKMLQVFLHLKDYMCLMRTCSRFWMLWFPTYTQSSIQGKDEMLFYAFTDKTACMWPLSSQSLGHMQ